MANRSFPQTPSEFYRKRRPEFFSDSEKTYEVKLPREHFAYELSQISVNQKQDAFETLCRRLAEKFISPNLIPQVGPTGGGDGKTDSETHPVSETLTDRWFVPENGWKKNENWAFAISAKQDWKSKIKSDVEKIVNTNRGYTKIFFLTNQLVASKKKKDIQDELKEAYGVEVIVLDGEWIIEKIYNNDLIHLAVDSLNLSEVYKNEKKRVGENDAYRIKKLAELEEKINNPNRYFEYDYQLVDDALEAAILTRMLERPRDEVIGRFDRALRLSKKVKNEQQITRVYYQRAWTYLNWYDDYESFVLDFKRFQEFAKHSPNINSLELYFNLLNLLKGITINDAISKEIPEINYINEEAEYIKLLEVCISNANKPTTSLVANTYKSFLDIFRSLSSTKDVSEELRILHEHIKRSRKYLEYPFESFKKLIEVFGEILPENQDYDNLIDCVAEISEERASELASGQTFFKRGFQKLTKGYNKDSLIYFGKSVRKLAKEESQDELYFVLMGLSQAYTNLGLLWASNNCIIAASSITVKEWYNEGRLTSRFLKCVKAALKNELYIGRVPYILSWYELFNVISRQFEDKAVEDVQMPISELVDACLSVRLLNSPYDTWKNFSMLPDLLERETLWLSQDTALYMLGYSDLVEKGHLEKFSSPTTIDEYYNLVANQPFKEQMVYSTNLLDSEIIEFRSFILGTEVIVKFKRHKELAIFAEILLANLESFLATSFEEVFPSTEAIIINIEDCKEFEWYNIIQKSNSHYEIQVNSSNIIKENCNKIHDLLGTFSARILSKDFVFKNAQEYLEKLYRHDEIHERQSLIIEHRKFLISIMGDSPKIFISDWTQDGSIKLFEFIRTHNPIHITETSKKNFNKNNPDKLNSLKHNQALVSSIIDAHLWDSAHWKGFGFFSAQGIPLGIFLAYESEKFGKQIFEDWIKRFGRVDEKEEINLSIIRRVNNDNPFWYRVHVSKRVDEQTLKDGHFMVTASRFHEMNATNPSNLTNLINGFNHLKQYILFPALFKQDGTIEPFLQLGILKRRLIVKDAWEVGEHDFDSVVIRKDDKPFIPTDKPNAPIINLLKRKNEK